MPCSRSFAHQPCTPHGPHQDVSEGLDKLADGLTDGQGQGQGGEVFRDPSDPTKVGGRG
jgi:hypothetical protein